MSSGHDGDSGGPRMLDRDLGHPDPDDLTERSAAVDDGAPWACRLDDQGAPRVEIARLDFGKVLRDPHHTMRPEAHRLGFEKVGDHRIRIGLPRSGCDEQVPAKPLHGRD